LPKNLRTKAAERNKTRVLFHNKNFFIPEVYENIRQNEASTEEYPNALNIKCAGIMKVLIY
jgi:hypothetical protein